MDLPDLEKGVWLLIPWPWWVLIGLAAGFFLLLGWSWLAMAKQADKHIEVYDHEFERKISNRAEKNGKGR